MQKRNTFIFLFFFLLLLSIGLIILFINKPDIAGLSIVNTVVSPIRNGLVSATHSRMNDTALENEVAALRKALRDQKKQDAELHALRDQFDTQKIHSQSLLPASIIGMSGYLPGVSLPNGIILDKGSVDGVKKGQVIVYKDTVIGKIQKVTYNASRVMLVYDEQSTVNAKTVKTNALGLVKGQGQGVMQLSGVVLSEKLEKGDQVVTKGEMDTDSTGYPPDLVIGKIISVDKKASSLFQSAQVESLVQIQKLTMVFIMTGK